MLQNGNGAIATLGTGVSVESSPFKGPKPQELSHLRKSIEEGNVASVESLVWENPRFLISSGDTPVILQVIIHNNAHCFHNSGSGTVK